MRHAHEGPDLGTLLYPGGSGDGAGARYRATAAGFWRYRTSDSRRPNSFLTTA